MTRIGIAQALWHAWNTGIHDEVLQHLREDAVVRPTEVTLRSFQGREEIDKLRADLERLGIGIFSTPFSWEEHGDHVVVRGRSRVVRQGAAEDMALTWVFRFEGDQVALIQSFSSDDHAMAFVAGA